MPECQGCGGWVSPDYARVFTPPSIDDPRACPNCEEMIRNPDGTIREARSPRRNGEDNPNAGGSA